jgi:hypothetical protein
MTQTTVDSVRNSKDWMEEPELRQWAKNEERVRMSPPDIGSREHGTALCQNNKLTATNPLKARISELEASIMKDLVVASPIGRLPEEIFSEIFACLPPCVYGLAGNRFFISDLARVSKQWHCAVIFSSHLWSHICLGGNEVFKANEVIGRPWMPQPTRANKGVALERWIANAKGSSLQLRIEGSSSIQDGLSNAMMRNAHRVECITITHERKETRSRACAYEGSCHPNLKFITDFLSSANGLRTLEYAKDFGPCSWDECRLGGFNIFSVPSSPTLRLIRCWDSNPCSATREPPNLQELNVCVFDGSLSATLWEVVGQLPGLLRLSVEGNIKSNYVVGPKALPHLQDLYSPSSFLVARDIARNSPNVTSLTVSWEFMFLEDTPRLPFLRSLYLICTMDQKSLYNQIDVMRAAYSGFPSLERVTYSDVNGTSQAALFAGLILESPLETGQPVCPRLSYITCEFQRWYQAQGSLLALDWRNEAKVACPLPGRPLVTLATAFGPPVQCEWQQFTHYVSLLFRENPPFRSAEA